MAYLFFEITFLILVPKIIIGNFRDQGSEFNHQTAQIYWLGEKKGLILKKC